MNRKGILPAAVMGMGLLLLTGFGSGSVTDCSAQNQTEKVPQLPETGRRLADFVPEGWEIYDSVELDFNEDGLTDYVGVLQETDTDAGDYCFHPEDFPRILFAIAGDGTAGYRLDFQDNHLIRDRGGHLTAEGASFTTHTESGSSLRWSVYQANDTRTEKEDTYTWSEGSWRRTMLERYYGYGDYITDYVKDDWENGVSIRKKRSHELEDVEKNYKFEEYENRESIEYDVAYELPLDAEPLTLEQIEKQRELSPYNVADWEVENIVYAEDVTLSEDKVKLPDENLPEVSCEWDENYVLYVFSVDSDNGREFYCPALYYRQDKSLWVLAEEEAEISDLKLYRGKIYYSTKIMEEESAAGVRLNRMNPDGTEKETIFEYRYQGTGQEMAENELPVMGLHFEVGGDEIVAQVYIGDGNPYPFYRMKTDGSGQEKIGQMTG